MLALGGFLDDRGVRSIVKGESKPHKGSSGPTMTPPLSSEKKTIIFGYAVAQIVNAYTSHLENVPTSLPATAPELDRQRKGCKSCLLPHRLHCMPCVV